MADEQTQILIPVEQKTVIFYDDELTAVRVEGDETNTIFVPVVRLCDNLGLSWAGQRERINRDEVLSQVVKTIRVTRMVKKGGRGGGPVDTLCLPLKFLPGWLFGINASRVKEAIREKLVRYKFEAYDALWGAFKYDVMAQVAPELAQPTMEMSPAERALATIEALHNLAKQQVAIERWLGHHDNRLEAVEDRLDKAAGVVGDQGRRLRRIELTIAGGTTVTDAQAAVISEAVKALAFELGKQETGKGHGNPYQRVYTELYRKFRVPSYKALPLESFPAVMRWLGEWWRELTVEEPPFAADDVGGQLELDPHS